MKVLHIFNELKFSGAEIMYANATKFFEEEKIETFAFATSSLIGDFESVFIESNIKVFHKPMPSMQNIVHWHKYIENIVSFIKEYNIDIIHIHRSNAKWLFALIAKRAGIASLYTVHNVFRNRELTWLKAYLERYTARKWFGMQFHSIGQSVYDNEKNYYKTPSIKINNWYDESRFYPPTYPEEVLDVKKKLGIPLNKKIIVSTGGCSWVKNHHDIIKAMPLLKNKDVIYLHLGSGITECEEKSLAEDLNIADNILFLGNKNNVRDYLLIGDVYLMPSRFEGLGNATLEAMAVGLPIVLYNVVGLKDLIHDNDNGLLIDEDHVSLAESINWIFNNKEKASKLSQNALRYVKSDFNMEKNVNQIIELYKNLIILH